MATARRQFGEFQIIGIEAHESGRDQICCNRISGGDNDVAAPIGVIEGATFRPADQIGDDKVWFRDQHEIDEGLIDDLWCVRNALHHIRATAFVPAIDMTGKQTIHVLHGRCDFGTVGFGDGDVNPCIGFENAGSNGVFVGRHPTSWDRGEDGAIEIQIETFDVDAEGLQFTFHLAQTGVGKPIIDMATMVLVDREMQGHGNGPHQIGGDPAS